jgi:hypothetical protein
LKALRNNSFLSLFLLCFVLNGRAQVDSLPYKSFKEKIVWFADLGYASAPFSIKYDFANGEERIKYRNNFRTVLGFGGAHKWFSLRLAISLPGNVLPVSTYGKTEQFNLGVDFTLKKVFFDVDFRNYRGYAIKNAHIWNDSLSPETPNDVQARMNAANLSFNAWYFHDKDFKMSAIRGKTGHYTRELHTWYLKSTMNFFGVGNTGAAVIPIQLIDSSSSKTSSSIFSAFDIGVIPGYAYVNKINNWQFSGSFGLGPVVQTKFYEVNGNTRSFIGLAPRYDIRLIGGYNVEKYFVMLVTDFDNKSIGFNDLKYRQSYYSIRIVSGIRLDKKEKKKKES